MADINRTADVKWTGELRTGSGAITTESKALDNSSYGFPSRFEGANGTNPEELIAAAHAACYTMNLAATLGRKGHKPGTIETHAICTLGPKEGGGFAITKVRLECHATVEGIDAETFGTIAREAEATCPVSNALRGGPQIELEATLDGAGA